MRTKETYSLCYVMNTNPTKGFQMLQTYLKVEEEKRKYKMEIYYSTIKFYFFRKQFLKHKITNNNNKNT